MRIAIVSLAILCCPIIYGQSLPGGTYQPVRERTIDILHCKAELEFEFWNNKVSGEAVISLTPLKPLDSLSLDAIGLNVRSVADSRRNAPLLFRSERKSLVVRLPKTLGLGETLAVAIAYDAVPRAGMYFHLDQSTQKYFVHTYGEGGLHANWLPIYNDVNDKFSSEMIVTVPPPYTVISNGKLIGTIMKREGFTTYHYLQTLPHSNYLISVYVGDFQKGSLTPASGSIPVDFWVPQGRVSEGAYAFRNTTKMVEFFSRKFDYPYPWDKYDQIAVPDYSIGAMEHTGVTGLRDYILRDSTAPDNAGPPNFDEYHTDWSAEALISHELAHHWFGNNVTCRSLGNIWLNESFASYLMMLWDEEREGRDQLHFAVHLAKKHYLAYVHNAKTIRPLEYHYYDDPDIIFNEEHTYLKGAVVLHMMRSVLGDDGFFRSLSHYLKKHQYSNVVSDDLLIAIQEVSGRNIEWFFKDWVTGAGHPLLKVNYTYVPLRKVIDLAISQVQPLVKGQGLFTLPLTVTIATRQGTRKERVMVKGASAQFLLACDDTPLMVSVDGEGELVAELLFEKGIEELIYQSTHDALPGRFWAMRELASRHPADERTVATLSAIIASPRHWPDAAEAAELLGLVRTDAALQASRNALQANDYRIRKGAVIGLRRFGPAAAPILREAVLNDSHTDVAGAALVALARVDRKLDIGFVRRQMSRPSWYSGMTIASLQALAELKNSAAVSALKPYLSPSYNQYVRAAALDAWKACAPSDKDLHAQLAALARKASLRLQQQAITMLGELYVQEGIPVLEEIVRLNYDRNLTVGASAALEKIKRVHSRE